MDASEGDDVSATVESKRLGNLAEVAGVSVATLADIVPTSPTSWQEYVADASWTGTLTRSTWEFDAREMSR